ncbi:MAG TPA: hypothetical protein VF351_03290 [Actinomycetota bacterium]
MDDARFRVEMHEQQGSWRVEIIDEGGSVRSQRSCRDHLEARTYASTVRQHLSWLSTERFREYYRL